MNTVSESPAAASAATLRPLLTVREAAQLAKVSPDTIRRLIEAGRLRAVNFATGEERAKWRIDSAELSRLAPPPRTATTPEPLTLPSPRRRQSSSGAEQRIQVW